MPAPASIEQILGAAASLFADRGYDATTMAEVAKAAGVSKGLPYVYFPSKRQLLDAVHLRAVDRWLKATQEHLDIGREPAIVSLKKAFRYSVLYSAGDPICRAIMAQDVRVVLPDSDQVRREIRRLNDEGFRTLLQQAVEEGDVRSDVGLDTLILLWRVTHDTLVHVQMDRLSWAPQEMDLADVVDSAIDILFNGMVAPKRRQSKASKAI